MMTKVGKFLSEALVLAVQVFLITLVMRGVVWLVIGR
jgi:hypothetical protein